jgi:hypothetical protein
MEATKREITHPAKPVFITLPNPKIMKRSHLLMVMILFLLSGSSLRAQTYDLADLVRMKQDTVSKVLITKLKGNQCYIPMDFNSADIKDMSAFREIKDYTVTKVELVYSQYRKSDLFSQPVLNIKRLEALKKEAPEAFTSSLTQWKFTAQTACTNEDDAKNLFHGFILTYRTERPAPLARNEMESMKNVVAYYTHDYKSMIVPASYKSVKKDMMPKPEGYDYYFRDTTVLAVLDRQKEWKDAVVVCDVTGSMNPYLVQTLIWLKLNCKATKAGSYTFFNDGDNKPDSEKKMGATGGVYTTSINTYDSVQNLMFTAMTNGGGGDAPENNIEAILQALKDKPDAKEIIMIADNYANVKDIAMLPRVNKPVRVIVCGADKGINTDYLNIAKATGGSIHTIERDLTDLIKLSEGETFTFKSQKYKLEKGKFKLLYDM